MIEKRTPSLAAAAAGNCPVCDTEMRDPPHDELKSTKALAEAGHSYAQYKYADSMKNSRSALPWLKKAFANGISAAGHDLMTMYASENYNGIPKSVNKARMYAESMSSRCGRTCFQLGNFHGNGITMNVDMDQSIEYYRLSSEKLYPEGVMLYAEWLFFSKGLTATERQLGELSPGYVVYSDRVRAFSSYQKAYIKAIDALRRLAVQESWFGREYGMETLNAQQLLCIALDRTVDWEDNESIDRSKVAEMLFWYKRAERIGYSVHVLHGANLLERPFQKCGYCNKDSPPERCVCGMVGYCNEHCQLKHWKTRHRAECKTLRRQTQKLETSIEFRCGYCSLNNPAYRCSQCREIYYCDVMCQKLHWKMSNDGHRDECCNRKKPAANEGVGVEKCYLPSI
jgi:hypothetical protein